MSDKNEKKKQQEIIIKALKGSKLNAMLFTKAITGESDNALDSTVKVYFCDFGIIFDAHTHIESLHSTPMPLQWAKSYLMTQQKTSNLLKANMKFSDRRVMGAASRPLAKDFIRVGNLPTDIVAKIFMGTATKDSYRKDLYWILWGDKKISDFEKEKAVWAAREKDQLEIEKMSSKRNLQYADFYINTAYYFNNHKVINQFIVLPMDLSYAHYWGKYSLPINLPVPGKDTFYFINDNILLTEAVSLTNPLTTDIAFNDKVSSQGDGDVIVPLTFTGAKQRNIYHDYDVKTHYQNFMLFLKNESNKKYGTEYEIEKELEPFHIAFDDGTDIAAKVFDKKFRSRDDVQRGIADLEKSFKNEVEKPYAHFLKAIPLDNSEIFEDYWRQLDYTTASVVRYPLQMFGFYHYDPRRHYEKDLEGTKKSIRHQQTLNQELKTRHAFYTYERKSFFFDLSVSLKFKFVTGNFLTLKPANLGESYFIKDLFRSVHDTEGGKEAGYLCSHEEMWKQILSKSTDKNPGGLFWGIKMYPPLGYRPDEFENYPHLHDLYKRCIDSDVPITFHSEPFGMTIADPQNYLLERGELERGKSIDLEQMLRQTEKVHNNPANWIRVLDKYSNLRLNFAHFGGGAIWDNNPFKYPDYRQDICDILAKYPNTYTDISYFENKNPERVAENLSQFIMANPVLKERIMMGSDWYMCENYMKGVAEYYNRMFDVLKRVSKEVGFDAWHQFAVINPLTFLGLLDPENKDADMRPIVMKKVDWYKENVEGRIEKESWRKKHKISIDEKDHGLLCLKKDGEILADENKIDSLYIQLKNLQIVNSWKIKFENELKILIKDF